VTAHVVRAVLSLRCTNASKDGGTVYPVADSSWIEGTKSGSTGPGLTWRQVDTNRDGKLDARDTSLWMPDWAHPVRAIGAAASSKTITVDVTAAFQRGAGIYTLAIRNASSDGVVYASRETGTASQRPQLRLEFGAP
jgi:hypothetical protein